MSSIYTKINNIPFTQFYLDDILRLSDSYKIIGIKDYGVIEININSETIIIYFYIRNNRYYYHNPKHYLPEKIMGIFKNMVKLKVDKKDICKVLNISDYKYNKFYNIIQSLDNLFVFTE